MAAVAMVRDNDAFNADMRYAAMERTTHDEDRDDLLDFSEFAAMIREEREEDGTEEELRARFDLLDIDKSGYISMNEFLRFALRESLGRSAPSLVDMFKEWDSDGSGLIDKKEFRCVVRSLGYATSASNIDAVFAELDHGKSGKLDPEELRRFQKNLGPNEVIGRSSTGRKSVVRPEDSPNASAFGHRLRIGMVDVGVRVPTNRPIEVLRSQQL